MKSWTRVVLAVAVLLFAAFILASAFRLLAGIEVAPLWGENGEQVLPDSDGDGMPNAWETQHGLNPNDLGDANQDPDGDGYTNYEEYVAGTDPNNPVSCPAAEVPVDGVPPHTPVFEIIGAPRTWFLRGSVGEIYEGGAWRMIENSEAVDYGGEDLVPAVEEFSSSIDWRTTIVPTAPMGGFVPVPGYAIRVENLENLKYFPLQQSFLTGSSFDNPYSVSYRIFEYDENLLESADTDPDPAYLQLPPDVTERTKQLAAEITEGTESPYKMAKAIENYLRTNYTYDLHYARAPAGWDPIDWFLFEERRGHCMNFNSAFVVLARSVGIPARTVFGYAVDPDAEYQIVYADDSHVNAEVKFENLGWVPFNATAPHPDHGGADSDGDGMPDEWEAQHGLNPIDPSDANTDPDGDGFTNLQEYQAGTDPNDPGSHPAGQTPTETEVTEVDEVGVKGGTFRVRGRVIDQQNGNVVDGVRVMVYLMEQKGENAPQYGYGWTENGNFDITCEVPKDVEVGDYYVVAHSLGNEVYGESWSDPKIKIVSGTTIQLSGPTRALVGREFSLKGRLMENLTGAGLGSREIVVEYGGSLRSLVTGEDGSFQVGVTLAEPDNYLVSASFRGSSYYLSSSSEHVVEASMPFILPTTGEKLARGEAARVSGEVPVEGLTVQIYFDNEPVTQTVSGAGGIFAAEYLIPTSMPLGNATVDYALPEFSLSETQEVAVCSRTFLEFDAPSEVRSGENLVVTGRLLDDSGSPLPGERLTLTSGGTSLQAVTGDAGAAAFELDAPHEGKELEFELSFEGSGFYLPSENRGAVGLVPIQPGGVPLPALVAAAVGAAALAIAVLFKKRKRAREKAKPAAAERAPKKLASRGGLSLEIAFPSIGEPLPDVWGAGDPFRISVHVRRDGKPVGRAALKVEIDGKGGEVRAPASGEWSAEHKFEKGTHRVAVEYVDGKTKLKAEREVRVVDYKEEVVGIFNSVLGPFREKGIDTGGNFTPREIQREAEAKIRGVDRKALDELVGIFEVANYSPHAVGRKEYERAYLSSRSVLSSMGGRA